MREQQWRTQERRRRRIENARKSVGKGGRVPTPTTPMKTVEVVDFTPKNQRGSTTDSEGRVISSVEWRDEVRWYQDNTPSSPLAMRNSKAEAEGMWTEEPKGMPHQGTMDFFDRAARYFGKHH